MQFAHIISNTKITQMSCIYELTYIIPQNEKRLQTCSYSRVATLGRLGETLAPLLSPHRPGAAGGGSGRRRRGLFFSALLLRRRRRRRLPHRRGPWRYGGRGEEADPEPHGRSALRSIYGGGAEARRRDGMRAWWAAAAA